MKPPETITDGVVVLRQLREDDRAVVLYTMRDPLVQQWLNMPREPSDRDFDALVQKHENGGMVTPEELVERAKDAPPREPREERPRRDGNRGGSRGPRRDREGSRSE